MNCVGQAKYGWTEQEMTSYLFVYRLGYILTLFILVPVMTSWINLSDNTIAIIACLLSATGEEGESLSVKELLVQASSYLL